LIVEVLSYLEGPKKAKNYVLMGEGGGEEVSYDSSYEG